jgi:predicted enzyme related to lactoylglutathione lyase
MNSNPAVWFEIYVQDMERAKRFYEAMLGVTLQKLTSGDLDMWAFPHKAENPGAPGALVRYPAMPSGGNSTLVYFGCEDCAIEEARIVPNGGRVQRPKLSIGQYGFITLGVDTEGNMFGLHSRK